MSIFNSSELKVNPQKLIRSLNIRKATQKDVAGVYNVACSVGTHIKNPELGFLVDDYQSDPKSYKKFIKNKIKELEHVYVAEYDTIYAFMIAYTKDEWLACNPDWIKEVYWKPDFDHLRLKEFVVVDKTAIQSHLTGMGIGSLLYEYLMEDLKDKGIQHIFAETIVSPNPNFASLQFRIKQKYALAGVRYEEYNMNSYTDLVYYKRVE